MRLSQNRKLDFSSLVNQSLAILKETILIQKQCSQISKTINNNLKLAIVSENIIFFFLVDNDINLVLEGIISKSQVAGYIGT